MPATLGAALGCADFQGFFPKKVKAVIDQNLNISMSLKAKYSDSIIDTVLKTFYDLGPYQTGGMMTMAKRRLNLSDKDSISWDGFSKTHKNLWGNWDVMNLLWIDTIKRQGPERPDFGVAKLRYLYEGRGVDISNWFTDIRQPTYRFSDGSQWSEGLAWAFIQDDNSLSKYSKLADKANHASSNFDERRFNYDEAEESKLRLCSQLKSDSIKSLSSVSKIPRLKVKSFDDVVHRGEFPKTFVNTCTDYHTHQQIGPKIPFLDASSFKKWYFTGDNKNKIYYRLTTDNALNKMPLNRHLENDELESVLDYLRLIME